jgi:hypothetical protein
MATDVAPLKGRELQRGIIELARRLGWRVAHTPPIPTERGWRTAVAADGKGFPDLVLVRDRVIVAEIKGDTDRLRPEQEAWLSAFRLAGIAAYVWTPEDWRSGEIERMLRARSQQPYPPRMAGHAPGVILCGCEVQSNLRGPTHVPPCPLFSTGQEASRGPATYVDPLVGGNPYP